MTETTQAGDARYLAAIFRDPIFKRAFETAAALNIPTGDPSNMSLDRLALENAYQRGYHDFGRRLASLAVPAAPDEESELEEPWAHITSTD